MKIQSFFKVVEEIVSLKCSLNAGIIAFQTVSKNNENAKSF